MCLRLYQHFIGALCYYPVHMKCSNRKEGNDQEWIQFPNTFRPRHQKERRMHLKQRHHNQNTTSQKGSFVPKIGRMAIQNKSFTRTYMQRHTMTEIVNHCRSTALEWSVKILLGVKLIFTWSQPLLLSLLLNKAHVDTPSPLFTCGTDFFPCLSGPSCSKRH